MTKVIGLAQYDQWDKVYDNHLNPKDPSTGMKRRDIFLSGLVELSGRELPLAIQLISEFWGENPEDWSTTVHLNARNTKYPSGDVTCIRCDYTKYSENVCHTKFQTKNGETYNELMPVIKAHLRKMGYCPKRKDVSHHLLAHLNKTPRKIGKRRWSGNYYFQKFNCDCPIHGEYDVLLELVGGV